VLCRPVCFDAAAVWITREGEASKTENLHREYRYTGLLETVRIRKLGYPLRHVFAEFVTRYGMVSALQGQARARLSGFFLQVTKPMKKAPKGTTNDAAKTLCKEIVHAMKISEANWQLGNEKIFLRYLFFCWERFSNTFYFFSSQQ